MFQHKIHDSGYTDSGDLMTAGKILWISNGTGEDRIATSLISAWQAVAPDFEHQALALVGPGHFYSQAEIQLLSTPFSPPSAGFAYLHPRLLLKDIQAGLLGHLKRAWKRLAQLPETCDFVMAVGDIVPLIAASRTQIPYAFVGCALSDYYIYPQDKTCWDPLQLWLLRRSHAPVFPRDSLTAGHLMVQGLNVRDLGNPMLDFPLSTSCHYTPEPHRIPLLFLPGSHRDAAANLSAMLSQLSATHSAAYDWLAIRAPGLDQGLFTKALRQAHWQPGTEYWHQDRQRFYLFDSDAFGALLKQARAGLGLAGTANEQAVGYGIPMISFAGPGQQYTAAFGEAQQRLLGLGLSYFPQLSPEILAYQLKRVLSPAYQAQAQRNAFERFGRPGAAQRIVSSLLNEVFDVRA